MKIENLPQPYASRMSLEALERFPHCTYRMEGFLAGAQALWSALCEGAPEFDEVAAIGRIADELCNWHVDEELIPEVSRSAMALIRWQHSQLAPVIGVSMGTIQRVLYTKD